MHIGERLRELRKSRQTTLVQLSETSGVDPATISRIENGKMTGTLASHMQLAKALSVSIAEFYAGLDGVDERSAVTMQAAATRSDVYVHEAGHTSLTILTQDVLKKRMMPTLVAIEPGGETQPEEAKPGTEKFVYLLEGEIEALIGSERFRLKKQQTLYFDATRRHQLRNLGKRIARCLCVTTPPTL